MRCGLHPLRKVGFDRGFWTRCANTMLVEPLTDTPTRVAFKKVDRVRPLNGRTSLRSRSMMFWGKVRPKLPDQENSRGHSRSLQRACDRKRRDCRSTRYFNIVVNRGTLAARNGSAARA
jgi:hypothetical protein